MLDTDVFIWVSDTISNVALVLLNKTLVASNRCVPVIVIVSFALPKEVLNVSI